MKISPEGLKEFIAICKEEYGVELSEGEAQVKAVELLLFYELIHQPLPVELEALKKQAPHPEPEAPETASPC